MMRSLRLCNFKCFEDQLLTLAPLTVLSGLNGMGKSSVLQALLLLRQSYHQGLLPATGLALNGDMVRLGTGRDVLYEAAEKDTISFSLVWQTGMAAEWCFDYDTGTDVMRLASGPHDDAAYETSLFGDHFQYLQAERMGPRASSERSDYAVRHHRQLGTAGQYTSHYLSVFGTEGLACAGLAHPAAASRMVKDQIEAWMGEISPGLRVTIEPYDRIDLVSLRYQFAGGTRLSNDYRPTNVGFGVTYTLPVVAAIVSARPGTLLLLENPEAHLHPRGQARVGELLALAAQCGVQVVTETHSDHVLNGIRLAVHGGKVDPQHVALHFLARQFDLGDLHTTVQSPRLDRDGRIDQWPDGFFDEWDRSLDMLLVPRDG